MAHSRPRHSKSRRLCDTITHQWRAARVFTGPAPKQISTQDGKACMANKSSIPRIGVTERMIRPANAITSLRTMHMICLKTDAYSLEESKRRDTALSWPSEWPYLHPSQTVANETFSSQTAVRDESFVGATGTYNVQRNNHIAPPSQERHASALGTGS